MYYSLTPVAVTHNGLAYLGLAGRSQQIAACTRVLVNICKNIRYGDERIPYESFILVILVTVSLSLLKRIILALITV